MVAFLAEFGSAKPNKLPSNPKMLRKNTNSNCFAKIARPIYYYYAMRLLISIHFVIK